MTKVIRTCRLCEEEFTSLTDFGVHMTLKHDLRRTGAEEKLPLRPVTCHRCASDIDVNVTGTCPCGFTLPSWASGRPA